MAPNLPERPEKPNSCQIYTCKILHLEIRPRVIMQDMESDAGGYALKNDEGMQINFRGTGITAKASGEKSQGAYALLEMTLQPNVGPALHISIQKAPEAYHVLEGECSVKYG